MAKQRKRSPRKDKERELRRRQQRARRAEAQFARTLNRLARRIGELTRDLFDPKDFLASASRLRVLLERYGNTLRPWASEVAKRMVLDVSRRDETYWAEQSKELGRALREEVAKAPTGSMLRLRMAEAANLITSLPLEAATRVGQLTVRAMTDSKRANEVAKEILKTGHVTKSRAQLIARTEVARTASVLVEARAKHVGSEGYIWRTAGDIDVRPRHRKLNGKFFRWDDPPVAGERGERAHAGAIYNCFVGETLIAPDDGHTTVFRTCYRGEIVVLGTAETSLCVTPNHPILTPEGWKAAGLLECGDQVIHVPFEGVNTIKQNVDDRLVTFSEIFEAFRSTREALPRTEYNFHGDVFHNQIDIVRPFLNLSSELDSIVDHCRSDEVITSTQRRISGTGIVGRLAQIVEAGLASFLYTSSALAVISGSIPKPTGFANRTNRYVGAFQYVSDGPIAAFVSSGKRRTTDPTQILLDDFRAGKVRACGGAQRVDALRITAVSRRPFDGHVFTSETVSGLYRVGPNGIIARNCRCYPEVVLPTD